MSPRHIIRRQVFEFDIPEEKEYPGFAQRISELQSSSFAEELDALLSALVPEDVFLRIDKIELDVGRLGIDDLGSLLIKRILEELEKKLLSMRGSPTLARALQSDPKARDLRLLAYFVEHARLPWWSPSQGTSIRAVTTRLLRDSLPLLRPLFSQWRHDPLRMRRWLGHVETHELIPAWKQLYPSLRDKSDGDLRRWVDAAVRLTSPAIGRDASRNAVRYILLSDLLEPSPSPIPPDLRNPLSLLKKATPFTALSDVAIRYKNFIGRVDRRQDDSRLSAAYPDRSFPAPAAWTAPAVGRLQEALQPDRAGVTEMPPPHSDEMAEFRAFLLSGHLMRYRSRSMITELVRLFRGLVIHELPSLEATIKDLGRKERIRRRIIDSISSPNIRFFFEQAVPSKKDLFDWVSDVYLETQKKMRPINQTNIRVQRSVDEITLEIYTSTDLNAITNATFLRLHLRRMSLKHHLRYEDLLSRIVESVGMPPMPVSSRFLEILRQIYQEDLQPARGQARLIPSESARMAAMRELMQASERELSADAALETKLKDIAARHRIDYAMLLEQLTTDRPTTEYALPADLKAGLRRILPKAAPTPGSRFDAAFRELMQASERELSADAALEKKLKDIAARHRIDYTALLEQLTTDRSTTEYALPAGLKAGLRRILPKAAPTPGSRFDAAFRELMQASERELSADAALEKKLKDIAARHRIDYAVLLEQLTTDRSTTEYALPAGWKAGLLRLRTKEGSALPADSGQLSIDPWLGKAIQGWNRKGLSDETALRRALRRLAIRQRMPYVALLQRIQHLFTRDPGMPGPGLRTLMQQLLLEDLPPTPPPMAAAKRDDSTLPETDEAAVPLPGLPAGIPPVVVSEGWSGDAQTLRPPEPGEAPDASIAPPPRPMAEPVPPELLRLLTREVMRALILAKGTGIFGKATRSLQELITAYIRLGKDPPQPEAFEAGELRQRISEYLDLESDFLAYALQFTARRHPEDAGLREIATTLSGSSFTLESPERRMTADEVLALAAHLTAHRVYYEIAQVKSLLLPALRDIRIDRSVFTAVMRLLFDAEASLVDVTLHRLLDRASSQPSGSASAEREEIYRAFISASLDVRNTPFSLNRVFADVRRRLQPDREEPFVLPTRLSEIKGHAFQDLVKAAADRKGKKGVMTRENAIIRLYNILHLDLLLQDVGARFFDNIPFSFELLLTRYREPLVDILHAKRLDPELAHFFAYTDQSRLFEQIRALYPRSRVERVSRAFGHAVELLQRSRWLTLDRGQLQAFGLLDSYAHLFARTDTELSVSDIVLDILQRAASERLLSRSFLDLFREPDDGVVLRRLGRRMGQRRLERLLPTMEGIPSSRFDALKKRIQLFRDLLPEAPREATERDTYLSLAAILTLGRFPEGHPFEGQPLESQAAYLAQQVVSGRLLVRLLADRPPRHATSILLAAVQRPPMVSAFVQQFGVDRATVAKTFSYWVSQAGDPGLTEEQLMREVLLFRQNRDEGRGEEALQRSVMSYLVEEGRLSFWQALKSLPTEGLQPVHVQQLLDAWPRRSQEGLAGPEPWYEFYFGVLTAPSPTREQDYKAIHAWAEYLFRHPAGRTRRRMLTLLVDTYLSAGPGQSGDALPLHLRFLETLRPFDRLPTDAMVRLQRALISAGVPAAAITTHLAGRDQGEGMPADAEVTMDTPPLEREEPRMRDIPTPKQLLSTLSRAGGTGSRVLAGLRRWVDDRRWSPAEARELADLLPARALQALLRSLAPSTDVLGVVDAWVELYRSMGWQPAARQAKREVLSILFTQKLWRYRTAAAIHAALLKGSGLPEDLRTGRRSIEPAMAARSRVPKPILEVLLEAARDRAGEGRAPEEEALQGWAQDMAGEALVGEAGDIPPASASDETMLTFFLETGMVPGIGRVAASASEYQEMAQQVASKGVAWFFSTRQVHPMHEEAVRSFFPPAALSEYIFSVLNQQASDPALRAFVSALSEEALRSRVRLSSLVRFIRLFRERTVGRPALGNAGVGRLLSDAMRISGFEALVDAASEAIPLEVFRRTRIPLLRRVQAERLRKTRRPRAALEQAVWFFLRTGMLAPDAGFESVDQLTAWMHERIRAGDTRIRSLLFQRSRDEAARQRVRRLIAGLEERALYQFVHPALFTELSELTRMMRQRFGIDVWRAVGARTERDRMDKVLQWWSRTRYRPDTPLRVLQRFMEAVTPLLDERQLVRLRRPEQGLLTPAERDRWQELRALIPDWIDAPPDEERKLKQPAASEDAEAMNDPEPTPDPADGIPVLNGGLVLLWPFLGRLFTRLQLTDGKNFLGDQELSRAIRITEYIVTGRTDMEEHQLALNKVLCGAPIDFQVPANIELSTEEADLCGKMLQGVIRNWEKLKTTKPDTFRETFLRREAMLYRIDERWELVVQRKAYDMLLDTLPWNISMIQLSWMPDRLVVQWK